MRDWWLYLDVGYTRQSGPRCPTHSGCGQDSEQADGHSGRRWLHVDPEGHPRQDHDQYGRHVHLDQEEADVSSKVELHLLTREVAWKTRTKNSAMAPAGCSDAGTNLKVGGTNPAQSARKKFFGRAPPLFWLSKCNYSFWWALSWWSVQFGQFLVGCSTHGAPRAQPFLKVGALAPMPYGVGATACSGVFKGEFKVRKSVLKWTFV